MVLLRVLPSMAACHGVSQERRGSVIFPKHPQPSTVQDPTHENTWGINRKSQRQRKVRGSSQLELNENDDMIAKSHPAVGTPRTSSQRLYRGRAGATTTRRP